MLLGIPLLTGSLFAQIETTDSFGQGTNRFDLVFVEIGDLGNPSDDSPLVRDRPGAGVIYTNRPTGSVSYGYRMAKYEVSEGTVTHVNAASRLGLTVTDWGPDYPAGKFGFDELAKFVNWLNLTTGHHPAYCFSDSGELELWPPDQAWQDGGENLFRHREAFYFVPGIDEWHKAAFWDPFAKKYWKYPTRSDSPPTPTAGGMDPFSAVYLQPVEQGPAEIDFAGGLSAFGTMAQGGNIHETLETPVYRPALSADGPLFLRGGWWRRPAAQLESYSSDLVWSVLDDSETPGAAADAGGNQEGGGRVASRLIVAGDTDGDGLLDADELIAGTDEHDAHDFTRLESWLEDAYVLLRFQTTQAPTHSFVVAQRYYAVEESTLGDEDWHVVEGANRIPGSGDPYTLRVSRKGVPAHFFRLKVWLEAGTIPQPARGQLSSDTFGEGDDTFPIEFVAIGDPGNSDAPATASVPVPMGGVGYPYRIAKYEVSEEMVTKANRLGRLGITLSSRGGDKPATLMRFVERARFVNWLNTSRGYHAAYNVDATGTWRLWAVDEAWSEDGLNQYRHKDAFYFIPSTDEWFKAGFYDGAGYCAYPTANRRRPIPVASGNVGGTMVYNLPRDLGPASVMLAGGLSFCGTMGQGGNVREYLETAMDGTNDSTSELLRIGGGCWFDFHYSTRAPLSAEGPWAEYEWYGFRVASRAPSSP